jgi:hypothetical protein
VLVLAAAAWPLVRGEAVDSQLDWNEIPPAWISAARDLDATLPADRRAVVLPGELFSFYDWGGTFDPILPTLADRPVALRGAVPYADLRAVDLLWTTDALVQQQRLLPGQLPALLDLLGAGAVISAATPIPRAAARSAPRRRGRSSPARRARYARRRARARAHRAASRRSGGSGPRDPAGRALGRPHGGMVRVLPRSGPTLLDGSAEGVAALAALGGLRRDAPLFYGADRTADEVRAAAAAGAAVVITDSNRRRVYAGSRLRQNTGATLTADEPFSADAAVLDPHAEAGARAQTVADYDGIRDVRAPFSPSGAQFPERRPFAALDGDVTTSWLADRALDPERRILEVAFERPRDVPHLDLLPHADARGTVTEVEIAGRRHPLRPGWNRLEVGLRDVDSVGIRLSKLQRRSGRGEDAGGIAEVRVPGLRPAEWLRPPVVLERALRGADLRRTALSYVLTRTTGDDPFRRSPATGAAQARLTRDRGDAERGLARRISPPAGRRWRADGWVTVDPRAPDPALDALLGTNGATRFASSGRFEGRPAHRASRAFDGDPRTAWVGMWLRGRPSALEWTAQRRVTVRRLRLERPRVRVRAPVRVRLRADGEVSPPVAVAADGTVALPAPLSGRRFRLEILAARFPAATPGAVRQRRAVGIGEIGGAGVRAPATPAPTAAESALRHADRRRRTPLRRPRRTAAEPPLPRRRTARRPEPQQRERRTARWTPAAGRSASAPAPRSWPCASSRRPARSRPGGRSARARARRRRFRQAAWTCAPARALPAGGRAPALAPARARGARRGGGYGGRSRGSRARVLDGRAGARRRSGVADAGPVLQQGLAGELRRRDLGPPEPIAAYANAWPVEPGCRSVAFRWAPQRAVTAGYGISAVACLVLLGVVALGRRPRAALVPSPPLAASGGSRPPLPPLRAAAWALGRRSAHRPAVRPARGSRGGPAALRRPAPWNRRSRADAARGGPARRRGAGGLSPGLAGEPRRLRVLLRAGPPRRALGGGGGAGGARRGAVALAQPGTRAGGRFSRRDGGSP